MISPFIMLKCPHSPKSNDGFKVRVSIVSPVIRFQIGPFSLLGFPSGEPSIPGANGTRRYPPHWCVPWQYWIIRIFPLRISPNSRSGFPMLLLFILNYVLEYL